MLFIILGTALFGTLYYHFVIKPLSFWKNQGVKQGSLLTILYDNWGWILGTRSVPEMIEIGYNRFPATRYGGGYQFLTPILSLRDPEVIKEITVKGFEHFTDHRPFIDPETDPLWGKNLFSLRGKQWRDMRSILSPSFTSSKMKSMFVLMTECAENFVQHFIRKDQDILTVEMKDIFTRYTNDVIATTAFGVKVDSLADPNNEFYTMGKTVTGFRGFWMAIKLFCFLLFPKIAKLLKLSIFSKETRRFFPRLIDETIKIREEKGIIRQDMIHLLMEARKGSVKREENGTIDTGFATALESDTVSGKEKYVKEITNEDITAQALIFFFAGFDSVSALMCFISYELAANQEIQQRLREEVQDTLDQCNGKLTYEALLKMKYLDMVVSESLRKWPNAIGVDRVCTKPYTIEPVTPDEKPVYLKKGTLVWLPIYGIHRDPKYYPDPERFDPERFNDENKNNIKPYTFLSFGVGPRNCIGSRFALLEVKTVFFYLLSHFEIVPVEKTVIPLKLSKRTMDLSVEGGFWFGLKRHRK